MPPRQQPRIADTPTALYRSTSCRIGTHPACAESSAASVSVDLPVIYEACNCPCHTARDQSAPAEVAR